MAEAEQEGKLLIEQCRGGGLVIVGIVNARGFFGAE